METLITILSGVLVTVATYLILSKSVMRVILGTAILSHGAHLLIMMMGFGVKKGNVPILGEGDNYVDALPQALILTSIVIGFAVTAVSLVLAYHIYKETASDDLYELRGFKDE